MTVTRGTIQQYKYQPVIIVDDERVAQGKPVMLWRFSVNIASRQVRKTGFPSKQEAETTLAELKELLGHSSLAMVQRYAHLAPDHLRAAVAALDDVQLRPAAAPATAEAKPVKVPA